MLGQLSPVCRSPCSKWPNVRSVMTKGGGRAQRADRLSGSMKRLFSPPEESQNAKRPRPASPSTAHAVIISTSRSLKVTNIMTEPEKTSTDPSAGRSDKLVGHSRCTEGVFHDGGSKTTSVESVSSLSLHREDHDEKDPGFTLITEQKADKTKTNRSLHNSLDKDALTPQVQETSAPAMTPALQGGPEEREVHPDEKEAARTSKTVGGGDQEPAGGTGATCSLLHFYVYYHIFFCESKLKVVFVSLECQSTSRHV